MAQISLTFPDGNARQYDAGVTPADVAADISSSLRKKAMPVIKDGWYYDFDRKEPFVPEDLAAIEKKMKEIINKRDEVRTEIWDRAKAVAYYEERGEPYKVELIEAIPGDEPLRMYWHGEWQDLCRGPHLQNTGQVPADAFKLMSIAGAYWRGDSDRAMLQRIYGCAFTNKEGLKAHMHMLEEAAKRDHRKLGREMDIVEVDEEHAREKAVNALKPMNCPCHVQIFNQGLKSYRDLPLRTRRLA